MSDVKGFNYSSAPFRYSALFKDGKWLPGGLTCDDTIVLNESACVLQYAQTCFEGLKAYRTEDGRIVCFRPDLNAKRLADTCERLVIPPVPEEMFIHAVDQTVKANKELVPDYSSGGSLYVRPFVFGMNPVLAVCPSGEFQFRVFVCPVGSYFGEKIKPLSLCVSSYDRAAPKGTGHIKAGLNYAMSLYPLQLAHAAGFDENVYLDPVNKTYIEETGGANIFFVTKEGKIVTPASETILPSITRRSMIYLAKNHLGLEVEERRISVEELGGFAECGLCGTAAVIAPVENIVYNGLKYRFDTSAGGFGKTCSQLRQVLIGVQHCILPSPEGWIHEIK